MPKIKTATIYAARNAFRDAFGKFVDPKNPAKPVGPTREDTLAAIDLHDQLKQSIERNPS